MLLLILACKGTGAVDKDEDGWFSVVDCDDRNPFINPAALEIPGDGTNNDCNLATRDDDRDQDGFVGLDDCNDDDPDVPGLERPYDGIDNDCDPDTPDDDLDGDGAGIDDDCNDEDAAVRPGLDEIPYDGLDNDCDVLTSDDDADGDGVIAAEDCDDDNPDVIGPAAWYADCDGDGYARQDAPSVFACRPTEAACGGSGSWTTVAPTGTPSSPGNDRIDCADLDPNAHPGQQNFFAFGITVAVQQHDYNCDGTEEREYGDYSCERVGSTAFCNTFAGFLEPADCGEQHPFSDECAPSLATCIADPVSVEFLRCR